MFSTIHSTTILALRHRGTLVFVGDGQVTVQNTIMKHKAVKIRRLEEGRVLAGFAGSAADAFTLFERFEAKLKEHGGKLSRAAVELAKEWRSDRYLRRLEAMMVVGDATSLFLISGQGDVIQPDDQVVAIGSGGNFALAAARALLRAADKQAEKQSTSERSTREQLTSEQLTAREIAEVSMNIAAEICPFTNNILCFEEVQG